MNTFTQSPQMALTIAHQTMQDRRDDAWRRAFARTVRAERRAECHATRESRRLSGAPSTIALPTWAFRFVHPIF